MPGASITTTLGGVAVAACLMLAGPRPADATLALNDGPGWGVHASCSYCNTTTGVTFGWKFSVDQTMTINGLGMWDATPYGLGLSYQVGLWSGDGATLLASATVTDASTPVPAAAFAYSGQWLFEDIAPLTLAPGTYLAGSVVKFEEFKYFHRDYPGPMNPAAGITLLGATVAPGAGFPNTGFVAPTNDWGYYYIGANLRIQDTQVPEPASLAILGLGLAGLGVLGRRGTRPARLHPAR